MKHRSDESLKQSWEANAPAWTRAVREGRIESRRLVTDSALVEVVTSHSRGRLLDVGCGEGWLARELSPREFDVVGIDGSEELVCAAQHLGGGEFHLLSYEDLVANPDALEGQFDFVVCNFSLLGEELDGVLRALVGQLARGGSIVVQTVHPFTALGEGPYQDGWREEDFARIGGEFPESMPWFYRTVNSWIREFGRAGLRVTDCHEPLHPNSGLPASLLFVCQQEA